MPEKIFSALNQTFLHFAKCILMVYKMEIKIFSKKEYFLENIALSRNVCCCGGGLMFGFCVKRT